MICVVFFCHGTKLGRIFIEGFTHVVPQIVCGDSTPVAKKQVIIEKGSHGIASKKFIEKHAKTAEKYCDGLKIYVEAVENNFFGKTVTCTGLIVGNDVLNFLKTYENDYDEIAISSAMLNVEKNMFLDDMTVDGLSAAIGKPIRVLPCDGAGFFFGLTGDINNE